MSHVHQLGGDQGVGIFLQQVNTFLAIIAPIINGTNDLHRSITIQINDLGRLVERSTRQRGQGRVDIGTAIPRQFADLSFTPEIGIVTNHGNIPLILRRQRQGVIQSTGL